MPPAARIDNLCIHPVAKLATGSPDTIIGGKKASRLGDISQGCKIPIPPAPHTVGRLVKCSLTVFINHLGAARVGDKLLCPAPPPTPGPPGGGTHSVKRYKVGDKDNYVNLLYAEGRTGEYHQEVKKGTAGGGVYQAAKKTADYKITTDALAVTSTGAGKAGSSGAGGVFEARASAFNAEGARTLAGKGENPVLEVGFQAMAAAATGKVDALAGSDGKRVGVGLTLKAGATPGKVEGRFRLGIPLPKQLSLDIKITKSVGLPGLGGAAGASAYYNLQEKRVHVTAVAGLMEFLGFSFDVSLGMRFGLSIPLFGIDAVAMGCMTVFIGG